MEYIKTYFFEDLDKINIISNYLADKESYIIDNYTFVSSYNTGLEDNNVITRSGAYNVFKLDGNPVVMDEYLSFISNSYYDYIDNVLPNKTFNNVDISPGLNCWLNVIRENEKIAMHKHSDNDGNLWSFVSATSVLNASNTSTNYEYKGEVVSINNTIGSLTIFPPFYNHWTDIHNSTEKRITLGMDISFHKEGCIGCESYSSNLVAL